VEIVQEIVDQGEGYSGFQTASEDFLAYIKRTGGVSVYFTKYQVYAASNFTILPPCDPDFGPSLRLRNSHLYYFAVIAAEFQQEQSLFRDCGLTFNPAREIYLDLIFPEQLSELASELPYEFNQTYLVLILLLSRMYETRDWVSDTKIRVSIEQNVVGSGMFGAIKPFLTLASCFSNVITGTPKLFQLNEANIPTRTAPQTLFQLYNSPFRSLEILQEMDKSASKILRSVSRWAYKKLVQVTNLHLKEKPKAVVAVVNLAKTQLESLAKLDAAATKIFGVPAK